jgi:hypothetical protein
MNYKINKSKLVFLFCEVHLEVAVLSVVLPDNHRTDEVCDAVGLLGVLGRFVQLVSGLVQPDLVEVLLVRVHQPFRVHPRARTHVVLFCYREFVE